MCKRSEQYKALVDLMKEKNWALMDMEYTQTSKTHRCVIIYTSERWIYRQRAGIPSMCTI